MPTINWSVDMSIGIPELDKLRMSLVEIVNQLQATFSLDESSNPLMRDDLAAMLRRFGTVSREYLALEKRYFLLYESFNSEQEKRDDAAEEMTCTVISGLVNYLEGRNAVDQPLLEKIKTWLLFHLSATKAIKPGQHSDARSEETSPDEGDI